MTASSAKSDRSWPQLAFDGWMLAGEMSMVIWLRSMRLMMGGRLAEREAERMVSEKLMANAALLPAMMAGGMHQSAQDLTARAIAHYRKPVRANRRRLSR